MYINSIRLLEDKRRSKLYFRYRIGGKTKDETLNVEWHSEKIGSEKPLSVKKIKSNKKTRRYAEKILSEKRHEMFENEYGLDYHRKQSESFLAFYEKQRLISGKTKSTKDGYQTAINYFKEFLTKKVGVNSLLHKQVNYQLCIDFREWLCLYPGIENTTRNKYFKTFKYVVAQAYNQGYLKEFVCKNIKGIKHHYKKHDYLTIDELKEMLNTPTPFMDKTQTRRFFIFSCLTALPHRECIELKWNDFDYETNPNGVKVCFYSYKRIKTGEFNKNPLSPDALNYLDLLYKTRSCNDYVFPNLRYAAHENMKLQTWANMSNVKKKITPHSARATFANLFVRIPGANIVDLQQLMGHSDIKTTLSYVGTSLKEKTKAVYQMPKVLGVEDGSFIETHETILVEN